MTHDWYYKYLDIPDPPKWMVLDAVKNMYEKSLVPEDNTYTVQGKSIGSNERVTQWVNENIAPGYSGIEAAWSTAGLDNLRVHTDRARDYGVLYILDTGGDNVTTSFYQEKGQPLIRDRRTHVDDYDLLDLLESAVFEKNRWILLYNRVLHNAANITKNRLYIQISYDSFDQIKCLIGDDQ